VRSVAHGELLGLGVEADVVCSDLTSLSWLDVFSVHVSAACSFVLDGSFLPGTSDLPSKLCRLVSKGGGL
jgi:hypothetical protein